MIDTWLVLALSLGGSETRTGKTPGSPARIELLDASVYFLMFFHVKTKSNSLLAGIHKWPWHLLLSPGPAASLFFEPSLAVISLCHTGDSREGLWWFFCLFMWNLRSACHCPQSLLSYLHETHRTYLCSLTSMASWSLPLWIPPAQSPFLKAMFLACIPSTRHRTM